jgi:hypothetical protein
LCEPIVQQAASADSFQVALDQWPYVSFRICDGEEKRGMPNLIETLMVPAVQAFARKVDRILAGVHTYFWNNSAGHLGNLSATTVNDYLLDTYEVMNLNNVPEGNRRMVIGTKTETAMLRNPMFVKANESGSTAALRNANIGNIYGFDFWRTNSQPSIRTGQTAWTGAINNAAGYAAGTTVVTIDGATGAFTAGVFVKIAGDDTPQRVTATTVAAGAGNLTISPGLKYAVADNAIVTAIAPGAINKAGGYAGTTTVGNKRIVGYAKRIRVDGFGSTVPQLGQPVAFGVATSVYTIIEVWTTDIDNNALAAGEFEIELDRPLETSLADNATVNLAPAGSYNLAFSPQAIGFANRTLALPRVGTLASTRNDDNGIAIRVVIHYDADIQAHIVTIDTLLGVAQFDNRLGAVMFG